MVVLKAAAPPGSQDAGGFRAHFSFDTDVPRISVDDYWGVTELDRSVSIKVNMARARSSLVPRRCCRSCYCLRLDTACFSMLSRYELHASTDMSDGYGSMTAGLWVPTSTSSPWRAWQVYGSQDARGVCTHCTFEPARSSQFGGEIAGGADFEWIPRGALLSCIPSTKSLG